MAEQIPRLREKIAVLIALSDLTSRTEVGAALDVKEPTIRWYEKGSNVRLPGTVPADKITLLIRLIRAKLPGGRSTAEVRHLLFGPLEPFAEAFTTRPQMRWPVFLSAVPERGLTVIALEDIPLEKGAAFLETDEAPPPDQIVLARQSKFRLRFALAPPLAGAFWGVFLQHDADGWDVLPLGREKPIFHGTARQVSAPEARGHSYRLHAGTEGQVQFAAFATRRPFPLLFQEAVSEAGRLTPEGLDRLASWLSELNPKDWSAARCQIAVAASRAQQNDTL